MLSRRALAALMGGAAILPARAYAQTAVDEVPPGPGGRRRLRTQDAEVVFPTAGRRDWAAQVPQIRIGLLAARMRPTASTVSTPIAN